MTSVEQGLAMAVEEELLEGLDISLCPGNRSEAVYQHIFKVA